MVLRDWIIGLSGGLASLGAALAAFFGVLTFQAGGPHLLGAAPAALLALGVPAIIMGALC
jgi:hypothetical protein